jgi:hypothetical protein
LVHHVSIDDVLLWWDNKTASVRSHCTTFSVCSTVHIVASVTTLAYVSSVSSASVAREFVESLCVAVIEPLAS